VFGLSVIALTKAERSDQQSSFNYIIALRRQEGVMSTIRRSTVLAAAVLGMLAGSARAQGTLVAKVPFPFVVHGEQLPAGRYEISNHGDGVLSILGTDNHSHAFAPAPPAPGLDPAGARPALVFAQLENIYQLSEIWESRTEGRALARPPTARQLKSAAVPPVPSEASTYVLAANWK
jgi:hypothetical protein